MAAERSRRSAPKAKAHVGALEELQRLKTSGTKRAETFTLKEEKAVYDVVEEDEYAKLVAKRREEAGGQAAGVAGSEACQHDDIRPRRLPGTARGRASRSRGRPRSMLHGPCRVLPRGFLGPFKHNTACLVDPSLAAPWPCSSRQATSSSTTTARGTWTLGRRRTTSTEKMATTATTKTLAESARATAKVGSGVMVGAARHQLAGRSDASRP